MKNTGRHAFRSTKPSKILACGSFRNFHQFGSWRSRRTRGSHRLTHLDALRTPILSYSLPSFDTDEKYHQQIQDHALPDRDLLTDAENVYATFAEYLPRLGIKRSEGSPWFGEPLLKLPGLETRLIRVTIPNLLLNSVNSLVAIWAKKSQGELEGRQKAWDDNHHKSSYLKKYPERPSTVSTKNAFDSARMLRSCRSLSALTSLLSIIDQKWTTAEIERVCQNSSTGQMKVDCWQHEHYPTLVKSPKFPKIRDILRKHSGEKTLILSDFPEFLMTAERVSQNSSCIALHEDGFYYSLSLLLHGRCFLIALANYFYVDHSRNFITSPHAAHVFWGQASFCRTRVYGNHRSWNRQAI